MADLTLAAEVAVVGAGPAGIAAATRAAEAGADVLVIDDGPGPGGQIWKTPARGKAAPGATRWIERLRRAGARLLPRAQIVLAASGRLYAEDVASGGRTIEIRAGKIIVATGARERFLPFPGWTLPNVIGVGAAQALVKSGATLRGRRVVVAGSGPLLLAAAASLAAGGAAVVAVAEQTRRLALFRFALGLTARPGKLLASALYRSRFLTARYRAGVWVAQARGEEAVEQVVLTDGATTWTERCDVLCCGYGLVPNLELPLLLGCDVREGRVAIDDWQRSSVRDVFCAGEATGIGGLELALVEGEIAGLAAASRTREAQRLFARREDLRFFAASLERAFALRPELKSLARPGTIVCRCEDVPLGRLDPSWRPRQAKLYARVGMGPCQGRVCGPALDFLFGWSGDSIRPPLRPTALSSFLSGKNAEREGTDKT